MAIKSIQGKLLRGILGILLPTFLITIAVVVFLSIQENRGASQATEKQIRASLQGKGKVLVMNNAQALSGMVADNAFLAVQALVSNTVSEDEDVVYGSYMSAERQAWVSANDSNPTGTLSGQVILDDSLSKEAAKVRDFSILQSKNQVGYEVLEFVAAVKVEEEIVGWIRYGISTKNLHSELDRAKKGAMQALMRLMGILVLMALVAFTIALFQAKRQSKHFSKPIQDLNSAANIIAGGDYRQAVEVTSDDEVGDLAKSFENMRQTVRQYTEHLEELVNAKMRQVRDILDNIDQGLFTVNMDGSINDEYSQSTNEILGLDDVSKVDIEGALRLSSAQRKDWVDWVNLVKVRLGKMRWDKIAKLAPVSEFEYAFGDVKKTVHVDYQPVLSASGELERIMVLVQDVTETRKIEKIIAVEKQRHENEVKTILGLVNTLPEVIQDFFKDTEARIGLIERNLNVMQSESDRARAMYPNGEPLAIDQGHVAAVFRDLHTIKGNAATYGFESLSFLANEAEDLLEALRPPIRIRTTDTIQLLKEQINKMKEERLEIDGISRKLRGGDQLVIHIAESKVQYLYSLAQKISTDSAIGRSTLLSPLFDACLRLRYVPLLKLTDKYCSMVERVSEKMNKQIEFICSPESLELPPMFFKNVNEAIVHILRNAVDHGIELPSVREGLGKRLPGRIQLSVAIQDSGYRIEISDDGHGIDEEALSLKAQELGFITEAQRLSMTYQDKLQLIFIQGLSTKQEANEISGRGVGMHAVRVNIEHMAGSIQVFSEKHKGTDFIIEVPLDNPWRMESQ